MELATSRPPSAGAMAGTGQFSRQTLWFAIFQQGWPAASARLVPVHSRIRRFSATTRRSTSITRIPTGIPSKKSIRATEG